MDIIKDIKRCIKPALIATLPVFSGYLVIGISFGIVMVSKGYNILYVFIMSLGIYAGSMQFVTVDLLVENSTIIAAILMTLFVNLRHLFYGITMLTRYRGLKHFKYYCIFALTDETFSLLCDDNNIPKDLDTNAYYFVVSMLDHFYWVFGSMIGGILGNFIPSDIKGLDFSMTALFVVIVVSQLEKQKNHLATVIGFVATFICLLVFGTKIFIIPSMVLMVLLLLIFKKIVEGESENKC